MRIIHTIDSLRVDDGGPPRSVTELCTALAGLGLDVGIITQRDEGPGESAVVRPSDRVTVIEVARQAPLVMFFSSSSQFAAALTRAANGRMMPLPEETPPLNADGGQSANLIIHNHGLWMPSNHIAARVAAREGCAFVVSTRGMLTEWAFARRWLKKRLAWAAYQRRDLSRVTALHATSDAEVDDIRRMGLRQPVAVIPNGVTIPDEWTTAGPNGVCRQALFLSRLHPIKGVINLVHAWARVRPKGWRLQVAGPSENGFRGVVDEAIRRAGMEQVITMSGPVTDSEKWRVYRSADLFILPSLSESFGIVVAEALASGLPVITTRAAPWRDIESRKCGWWVGTDIESLAHAIEGATALTDQERAAMGRRGRALIMEKYAWGHVARKMASVYAWLSGRGDRPNCVVV